MSKTDADATFMRMKEDHMGNGQLKPAYNIQISSENGYVTNYTIHQTPGDTTTYQEHMEAYNELYDRYPRESIADAGYGSEENYLFAKEKNITPYIKYNYFHKEQSKKWKNDLFKSSNFHYNKDKDCCYCPMGQQMNKIGEKTLKLKQDLHKPPHFTKHEIATDAHFDVYVMMPNKKEWYKLITDSGT